MRREYIVIGLLVIAIIFLIGVIDFVKKNVEQADAKKFVLEELNRLYPDADAEIISMAEKTSPAGSKYFEIKSRVTRDAATPCPRRIHIYFNYPEQNFVPQPPEYVTQNCQVCVDKTNCVIGFQEEAIIASHTLVGTEEVATFIKDNNAAYPAVTDNGDSWLVEWNSPFSTYYYNVKISKNTSLLEVQKLLKKEQ
jgi:hypothetical protein